MATAEQAAKTASPVELIRTFFETLNQRDADALLPFWADDVVEEFPEGVRRGPQQVRDYFAEVFQALPDFHIEVEAIAGEGETVFVNWRLTGTFSGAPWLGIDPTGTRLEIVGTDRFTVRDGKIVHNRVVFDQMSFARQIGLLPEQDSRGERAMTAAFNARTRLRRRLGR